MNHVYKVFTNLLLEDTEKSVNGTMLMFSYIIVCTVADLLRIGPILL